MTTKKRYIDGTKLHNTVKSAKNTAEYVVSRLADIGIEHAFTVPGDFAFTLDRALINNSKIQNIVSANELNASYAADGYARVKGAAILCTTYGVGELSALCGVMGAKAENNIIFHLVGAPAASVVKNKKCVHHTLGDGVFGNFVGLSTAATCVSAIITPENAVVEMNRVIKEAFKYRQPAYIMVALDSGKLPVVDTTPEDKNCCEIQSIASQMKKAVEITLDRIKKAKKIVIIPSLKLDRYGITEKAAKFIEKLNVPFVIMPHDKSVLPVNHKNYAGFYAGVLSDAGIKDMVEGADLVINLGDAFWSDFSTAGFTTKICCSKILNLGPLFLKDSDNYIDNIFLGELLDNLHKKITAKNYKPKLPKPSKIVGKSNQKGDKIALSALYEHFMSFVKDSDTLFIETGSSSLNLGSYPIKNKFHNQTLWGAIGWATPAAFGGALANANSRVILLTGEGSHQLTLNDIGPMGRYGVNPVIICVNNNGFMVERALEEDQNPSYDNLAQLEYAKLPEAFGCKKWISFKVSTIDQLKKALVAARKHKSGVYIEVMTGTYDYGETLSYYHQNIMNLYK